MALRDGYSSDLTKELNSISEEKEAINLEISKLTKKQLLMTDENRKKICYKMKVHYILFIVAYICDM